MGTKIDVADITGIDSIKGQVVEASSLPVVLATEQDFVKAEDTAHTTGDYGAVVLAVRQDTAAALAGTDADYIPLIVDASGRLHVALSAIQKDDTDKLAVSLYGQGYGAAAGDTALLVSSAGYVQANTAGVSEAQVDNESNTLRLPDDVDGNPIFSAATLRLFNGTTWDRQRGNQEISLLVSGDRTASTLSPDQTNYNARGVILWLNVTVRPAAETVTPMIQVKDPVSGLYTVLFSGVAVGAVATYIYLAYPGMIDTGANITAETGLPLARTWRVSLVHSGSGTFTYSLGGCYLL